MTTSTVQSIVHKFFDSSDDLPQRLSNLCNQYQQTPIPDNAWFSSSDRSNRNAALMASILNQSTDEFYQIFQNFFVESLQQTAETSTTNTGSQTMAYSHKIVFEQLRYLHWITPNITGCLLQTPLIRAIRTVLYDSIKERIAGEFDQLFYEHLHQSLSDQIVPWMERFLEIHNYNLEPWLAEIYCQVRIEEIFEIITCYPESEEAVRELKDLLDESKGSVLADTLKTSLMNRLTHPGADTSQIIDVYINTIKVLKILDRTDRLLSVVAEPVRVYLRDRTDTVRCILTNLTDADADLYDELRRQDAKPLEYLNLDSDDEEEPPTMDWQPPPSLFQPRGNFLATSRNESSDILAMLVSIYGSKELFVNEYRLMLADKLLSNLDYNTDKERHTLELLKLRFGEVSMQSAEVMIKDIDDSVRANKNISEALQSRLRPYRPPNKVDAVMISHIFWPSLTDEPLKHHSRVQAELDDFGDVYSEQKNPRKLVWMNQLGSVTLDLEVMENNQVETREIICSPLHATLIFHFEDQACWTAQDLSNETNVPEATIQKRMAYWISQGVVVLVDGVYSLASQSDRTNHRDHQPYAYEHDVPAVSATAQQEEEMHVYESYIVVMLTSLKTASVEKIHNMLKMMVTGSDTKYNKTPQQLSAFLQHLCATEKLECGPDGLYKLFKK